MTWRYITAASISTCVGLTLITGIIGAWHGIGISVVFLVASVTALVGIYMPEKAK